MQALIDLLIENPLSGGLFLVLSYAARYYYIWLPFVLMAAFWRYWIAYIQSAYIASQEYILLEFKLPREIEKTPLAMEQVFSNLSLTAGETTFWDRIWGGKVRAWFSFEIVSIEGAVHFFVWTREAMRNYFEAQIYANYPTVEIHEVPDYAKDIFYNPEVNFLWGCDMVLKKPDPYPIKTYVDYGLESEQQEEETKVDPLSPLVEFMSTMKKGEMMALQIIARGHKKSYFPDGMFEINDKWQDDAKKEIEKIRQAALPPPREGQQFPGFPHPTKGQSETIAALERSVSKFGMDAGIRVMYFVDKKENIFGTNIPTMLAMFRQFGSNNLNAFTVSRWDAEFDYPWQDFRDILKNRSRRRFVKAWKRRSYFHAPYKSKPYILNTEEMATLFHFPGRTLETPTFARVPSKKASAPANLPV